MHSLKSKGVVTIGVDSSTTHCGVALFVNGDFKQSETKVFKGTYNIEKLINITKYFEELFSDYGPEIVLIEEPAPVRNSRAVTGLNQVAGAIVAVASLNGAFVDFVHNKTVKKTYKIMTKDDSFAIATRKFGIKNPITDHESDAILVVGTYMHLYGD